MQFIQTSKENYLRNVRSRLADIYTDNELELNLQVDYGAAPSEIFRNFAMVEDIHELDKKEIYNYAIAIFGVLTDIKEENNNKSMTEALQVAFSFIEGYTKDSQTQVKLFTLLYNVFKQTDRYRYDIFCRLLSFCEENNCIVAVQSNLLIIDQIANQWEITKEERITLYKRIISILIEEEKLAAFELMLKTIKLFGNDEELTTANKDLIIKTITLALEHPKLTQFEYLYNIAAVQILKSKKIEEKIIELVHIFAYEKLEDYTKWEESNKDYLEASGMESTILKNKILYLSFFSLALKDRVITFDKLAQTVGISKDEIEEWVTDAIVNGIIDARIDQEEEQVIINTFAQRSSNLKERVEKTMEDFNSVLKKIDA
ncbi:unnamed protein product [Moneuplotes crassus]|uniref:PCI domain-containing protein n=1 Tax=Euplotes crassus TaxID=5936 RepID=A0AAD1XHW4_EUPCR|nr:unnamed protein product [Moneuplotes crassus]